MTGKSVQLNGKRQLKVYYKAFARSYSRIVLLPEIRLCGKWLRDIDFDSGKKVTVEHSENKIIITVDSDTKVANV